MRGFTSLFRFPEHPDLVSRWFIALAAIDLTLVAIFLSLRLLQGVDLLAAVPWHFDIFHDSGLPERFNHVKWAAISLLMLLVFLRSRVAGFLSMALVFAVIFADDAMRLHETGSARINALWPGMPKFGMTAAEAGEVAIWALLGTVVVPVIVWGLLRTPRGWWGQMRWPLTGFAGLLFFAIGMDVAQQPLWHLENKALFYWGKTGLGLVEDTGEAIFGSLTLAYAVALWQICPQNGSRWIERSKHG